MDGKKQVRNVVIYVLLLVLAVPWYWPNADTRHLAGLPLWVLTVLFVAFCAAVFTAWNLLHENPETNPDEHPD